MKRHLLTIIFIFIFLLGLAILLYPLISDAVNSRSQSRAIAQYDEDLVKLSEQDYAELLAAAQEYNEKLPAKNNRYLLSEQDLAEYQQLLNFNGKGMLGTIEIDIIGVKLPLYLSTDEAMLQNGIGHFEGSSLPIGGLGTHSVITGHRGLPSSTLLTNLDKIDIGDTFTLRILKEVLLYEVDQILIVEPEDVSALAIVEGMDYCTIVTCTPYGINTHRLLVRGHRIANITNTSLVAADARAIDPWLVMFITATPMLLVVFVYLMRKYRRR